MNNKSEILTDTFDIENPDWHNVHYAFKKLITPLAMVTVFEPYKKSQESYKKQLSIVLKWAVDYEVNRDLSIINHIEMNDVYKILQELRDECICANEYGYLSDDILIWIESLITLRNNQIKNKEGDK